MCAPANARLLNFLLLITLTSLALGIPTPEQKRNYVLHEKREAEPLMWSKLGRVKRDVILPVRIGMKQSNLDVGPEMLDAVSDPSSPQYGKHYTAEQVHDMFAPEEESIAAIRQWLQESGVNKERIGQSANKQWIQLDAPVEEIEGLINAEYHHYEHSQTGRTNIGCDEYHVPAHVQPHIDYITPGLKLLTPSMPRDPEERATLEKRTFGVTSPITNGRGKPILPPRLKPLPSALASLLAKPLSALCQQAITPKCISTLYGIPQATKKAAGNELGIFEDLGDKYAQEDLNLFFAALAPNIPLGTHPVLEAIDGATAPAPVTSAGPESDLDFQISYPIIYPQKSVLFQTDDDVYEANYIYQGFLNNFLDAIDGSYCSYSAFGEKSPSPLDPPYPNPAAGGYKGALQCGKYAPTKVISISYGGQEADLPASYQKRQCNEYMKLGLQGVSIVVASGDSGVAGPANSCLGPNNNIFSPDFPATCPYLTTVGSTFLPPGADVTTDQETATTRFASGGGFSNIYPIPSYQASAVAAYFASTPPTYPSYSFITNDTSSTGTSTATNNGGVYNRLGRGYPDVSAVGDNIAIFNKGAPTLIGGTSASAPVFAAILNRINEERIANGKGTVGFVNPVLYKNPRALRDVTTGSNPGCGTDGFKVGKGWDPVTGLGTPKYADLLKLFT